jgi:hypothetical protein
MKFKGVSSSKRTCLKHGAVGKFYVSMKTLTFYFNGENVTTLTLDSQPNLRHEMANGLGECLGTQNTFGVQSGPSLDTLERP